MSGDKSEEAPAAAAAMGSRAPSTVAPLPAPAQRYSPLGISILAGSILNWLDIVVLTIDTGEDVYAHLLDYRRKGQWGVCILAARGAISDVKFTQPVVHGHYARSRHEIVSMSGLFLPPDVGDVGVGEITTFLADSYGYGGVFGGVVDEILIAASPVQLVLGSFEVVHLESGSPGAPPKSPKLKLAGAGAGPGPGPSCSTSAHPV